MKERRRTDRARLESLVKISQYHAKSVQDLLDYALGEAITLTRSAIGYLYFYNAQKRQFILNSWSKGVMDVCSIMNPQTVYDLDKTGLWGETVRQKRPIVVNDFSAPNPLKKGYPDGHAPLHRFMTVPVIDEGNIVAALGLANKKDEYDDGDIHQATLLMNAVWQIAERKRVEDALAESRQMLHQVITTLPVSIYWKDPQLRYLGCNSRFAREAGLKTAEEIIGKTDHDLSWSAQARALEEADLEVLTTGRPKLAFEECITSRTGDQIWLRKHKVQLKAANGKTIGVLGSYENITAQKANEADLQRHRDFIVNVSDGCFEADLKGNITFANEAMSLHLGYPRRQLIGMNHREYTSPAEAKRMFDIFKRIYRTGQSARVDDYLIIDSQGQERCVEMSVSLIRDADGNPKGFRGTTRDISEKRNAEEALKRSEDRNRMLFDNIPVPTLVWKAQNGGFILAEFNQEALRFIGDRIVEFVGKNAKPLFKKIPHIEADIRKCMKLEKTVDNQYWYEPGGHLDKRYVIVKYAWTPPDSVLMHVNDITGQKRAEENLQYISIHDSLTGLFNRFYADAEIERMADSRLRPVSVIIIDLDNLKTINDEHGHATGDMYIKSAAALFKQTFRPDDMIARIGGDEFLVLLPLVDEDTCVQALERLIKNIQIYNQGNDQPVHLSAGNATARDGCGIKECIRAADKAMYMQKANRKIFTNGRMHRKG